MPEPIEELLRAQIQDDEGLIDVQTFLSALLLLTRQPEHPDLFVAAGPIARRAWEALRVSTDELVARLQARPPEAAPAGPWDAFLDTPWARGVDVDAQITRALLEHDVLVEQRRRAPARKATLMDLVGMLETAMAEATARQDAAREAEARRARAKEARSVAAATSFHEEDLNAEIQRLRALLPAGGEIVLRDLAHTPADLVGLLQATVHLAREGVVVVEQSDFPFGKIRLRMIETQVLRLSGAMGPAVNDTDAPAN